MYYLYYVIILQSELIINKYVTLLAIAYLLCVFTLQIQIICK